MSRSIHHLLRGVALACVATALSAVSLSAATLRFVREGIVVSGEEVARADQFNVNQVTVTAMALPDGQGWLLENVWQPRQAVRVTWTGPSTGAATATAPLRPAAWVRWSVSWPPAEWLSTGTADETTALAFSVSGGLLAAGSQQGRLAVISAADGSVRGSQQRAGRVIRQVAFSPDGARLYVGEQGAEGRLAAYDPGTLRALWALDAAVDVGHSPPVDPKDPYGWVTQPGAYRVLALDGDVLAAFSRSWNEPDGRHARSRLYRVDGATGAVRWAYPKEGAQAGVLSWFTVDAANHRLLLPVQSPMGAGAAETQPSRVVLLDLDTGAEVLRHDIAAVAPYPVAGLWRGLAVQPGGDGLAVTTDDGRAFLWRARGNALTPVADLRLVEPVKLGGVTVTATNGALAATARGVIFATGPTYVPPEFGGGGEPTLDHPHGNTLFAYSWAGRPQWIWRLDNDLQGVETDAAGRWLAVAQGAEHAQPADRFQGVALLDLAAADAERVVYRLPLEGRPVFGTMTLSPDGHRLAVAETPRMVAGEVRPRGSSRLLLVR